MRFGKPGEGEDFASGPVEMVTSVGEADLVEVVDDTTMLLWAGVGWEEVSPTHLEGLGGRRCREAPKPNNSAVVSIYTPVFEGVRRRFLGRGRFVQSVGCCLMAPAPREAAAPMS